MDYIAASIISFGIIGIGTGVGFAINRNTTVGMIPVSISKPEQQNEGDTNDYLVLTLRNGRTVPFVKQPDGNYIRLDDAHRIQEKGLTKRLEKR